MAFLFSLLMLSPARATELQDLTAQLKRHSAPGAVSATELAPTIVSLAHFYGIQPSLLASVVLAESHGLEYAVNYRTHDSGIMQVNVRKAVDYNVNQKCLMMWRCGLAVGARILASKPNQPCAYNLGANRAIEGKYVSLCNAYLSKLAQND
ncbi:MAG: hypothetical protein NVS1B10_05740 [Candidatus Saccharimonadales bacterium]